MGTFTETAIVDYLLPLADEEKQFFSICLQQTNGRLPFFVSKQTEVSRFPFAANKSKSLLSISSIFRLQHYGNMETMRR
jgi:hypothetical protein